MIVAIAGAIAGAIAFTEDDWTSETILMVLQSL